MAAWRSMNSPGKQMPELREQPEQITSVDLADVLCSLSLAEDLANGNPEETALRAARLAGQIAEMLQPEHRTASIYTTLLRFLGCTSFASEETAVFFDDHEFKRAFAGVDSTNRIDALKRGYGLGTKARSGTGIKGAARVAGGGKFFQSLVATQCETSSMLAASLGLPDIVCKSLTQIYERFDGLGKPRGLPPEQIELPARIASAAYTFEIYRQRLGIEAAQKEILSRAGTHFDPAVTDALAAVHHTGGSAWDSVTQALEGKSAADIKVVALAFGDFADLKSRYTPLHSRRTAALARAAASVAGMSHDARQQIEIAALLMNTGMCSVSTAVIEKPERLSRPEKDRLESHTLYTERILSCSPALAPFVDLACSHHERTDGTGYHRRRRDLSLAQSILSASDAFVAMSSARAYRSAFTEEQIKATLLDEGRAGRRDLRAVQLVLEAAGLKVRKDRGTLDPSGLSDREIQVLRFLSAGLTNKQIADELLLSARTVQHHTIHIYEKLGVQSRAAAALAGAQRGIIE